MEKYIAFLRGINVSGQKKILMKDLWESIENLGFTHVKTYIQSGNLIFDTKPSSKEVLARKIEMSIKADFGFEVPILIKTKNEIIEILDKNPFVSIAEEKNQYFSLLHQFPKKEQISNLNPSDYPNEEFFITNDCVYLNCKLGAGKAKLSNNVIERKLGITATTRNLRTMKKMIELTE